MRPCVEVFLRLFCLGAVNWSVADQTPPGPLKVACGQTVQPQFSAKELWPVGAKKSEGSTPPSNTRVDHAGPGSRATNMGAKQNHRAIDKAALAEKQTSSFDCQVFAISRTIPARSANIWSNATESMQNERKHMFWPFTSQTVWGGPSPQFAGKGVCP